MSDLFDTGLPMDSLDHLDDPQIREKWPRSLVEMMDVCTAAFERDGESRQDALNHAFIAMQSLARYFGGRMFYLPTGETLDLALRNKRIWHEFNGKNVAELASRWKLTEIMIYNILREQKAIHKRRIQPDLFPPKE